MIDLSEIGNAGLVLQYEDIISMIGFNIAKQFKANHVSEKFDNMTVQEILSSYLNREYEDYTVWLDKEFGITGVDKEAMNTSFLSMQPNLIYAYKIFPASHREHKDNLYIYSDTYSPIAEQSLKTYGCDCVQYIHSDLPKFIKEHPNLTLITSSIKTIDMVKDLNVPICLVVCDDYLYTINHFTSNRLEKEITGKGNIFLRYTSVIRAGVI